MSKAAELAKIGEVATNSQIGGRRNIIINGGMNVAQRGTSQTGITATANEGYVTVDRFSCAGSSHAGVLTMTQTADGPSGFANCIKLDCTTADTSIAAGEYLFLATTLEGQDVQQFKKGTSDAEQFTVSFYVKGNANAVYTLELLDNDNGRQISKTFAVTSSWNRIILTYPADTTGAFDDDNAGSFGLYFYLHSGSTYNSGTLNSTAWASTTNANRISSDATSFFDSTDRTFFITGLQLEVGSVATPFEHRSFGEELALCQRYCNALLAYGTGDQTDNRIYNADYANANGMVRMGYPRMRDKPTQNYTISGGTISNDFSCNGLIQLMDGGDTNFYIYDILLEKEL